MRTIQISSLLVILLLITGQSQCGSGASSPLSSANDTSVSDDAVATDVAPTETPETAAATDPTTVAAANPPWSPSSAGSIECALPTMLAWVSLSNMAALEQEPFSFEIKARNAGMAKYSELAFHELQIHSITYQPIEESVWKVRIGIVSTVGPPPTVVSLDGSNDGSAANPPNDWCEEFWADILQKEFLLDGRYERPRMTWQNQAAPLTFSTVEQGGTALINPFILEAQL